MLRRVIAVKLPRYTTLNHCTRSRTFQLSSHFHPVNYWSCATKCNELYISNPLKTKTLQLFHVEENIYEKDEKIKNTSSNKKKEQIQRCGFEQNSDNQIDFAGETLQFLQCVKHTGQRHGQTFVVQYISGSKNKALIRLRNEPYYGVGAYNSQRWWKEFSNILIDNQFIQMQQFSTKGFARPVLVLTKKGQYWLSKLEKTPDKKLMLTPSEEFRKIKKKKKK